MNKNIKPLVIKIHQCAQKNEDLKWVMNTEGKIPIMVSTQVNLSGNLKKLLQKNTHYSKLNFTTKLTNSDMKPGTQLL